MKNILITAGIILAAAAFMEGSAQALTVGDEITIGESYTAIPFSKFQVGGVTEFVVDKDLGPETGTKKMTIEGYRALVKPTISVFENLDLYAKLGVGKDKIDDSNKDTKIDSDLGLVYGGGIRTNLISLDDIGIHLGLDVQYLRLDTGIDSVRVSGLDYSSSSGDFTVEQWQAAIFIVKETFQTSFYVGGDYSDSHVRYEYEISSASGNNKGDNDSILGVLGGINVHITDAVVFFAEGHFIDETSLSLGVNARF